MENLMERTNEEIVKHVESMERPALKEYCEKLTVRNLSKLMTVVFEELSSQTSKFIEKKKGSAGLKSRKATGYLETIFMAWRKKSILATKDTALLDS